MVGQLTILIINVFGMHIGSIIPLLWKILQIPQLLASVESCKHTEVYKRLKYAFCKFSEGLAGHGCRRTFITEIFTEPPIVSRNPILTRRYQPGTSSVFEQFSFHGFLNLGNSKKPSKTVKN